MEGAVQRLVADRVELHENEVPRSDLTSIFCSDPLAVNELPHGELASCCCDGSVSRNCWGGARACYRLELGGSRCRC